jgi:hypothetical protein
MLQTPDGNGRLEPFHQPCMEVPTTAATALSGDPGLP